MTDLRCQCGGIILADTEDFKEPLCPDCLFEFIKDYPIVKAVIDEAKRLTNDLVGITPVEVTYLARLKSALIDLEKR